MTTLKTLHKQARDAQRALNREVWELGNKIGSWSPAYARNITSSFIHKVAQPLGLKENCDEYYRLHAIYSSGFRGVRHASCGHDLGVQAEK